MVLFFFLILFFEGGDMIQIILVYGVIFFIYLFFEGEDMIQIILVYGVIRINCFNMRSK